MVDRASLPVLPKSPSRCGPVRSSRSSRWRALVLVLVHVGVIAHIAHWKIAGTTLGPLEPSEAMQTLELGYLNAGFLLFVAAIVLTLAVGRFFCGWACHVVAYQDLSRWLLGRIGLRPEPVRSRLLVFVPLGAALYMFAWPQVVRLYHGRELPAFVWHLSTDAFWATFPAPAVALLTFLVDGFLIVYLLGGKGFCTYGCPYGAVFGMADRVAPVRIRVTDACEQCGHCTATCTSNVRVHEEVARHRMVIDPGCMKCLDCVSVCPKDALYLGAGPLPLMAKAAKKRKARAFDFTWPEELALALVFLLALYAWRGLYGAVPFLLALGLSVITAAAAIVLWRLLRGPALTLQHHVLKQGGRPTRAGLVVAGCAIAWLLLAAHCGAVQYHYREGERWSRVARDLPAESRQPAVDRALRHLLAFDELALVRSEAAFNSLSGAYRIGRDYANAAAWLRRSIAVNRTTVKLLELSTLEMLQGNAVAARQALEELLHSDPEHAEARLRLSKLR